MDRKLSRREFIGLVALGGLAPVVTGAASRLWPPRGPAAGGLTAPAASEGGTSPHRWAMVIDQGACIGCNYCTYGCIAANDVRPDVPWNVVNVQAELAEGKVYVPRPCMHCEHPPCVAVCPVKATYQRPDGLVVMDYDRCIGCRYCMVACPYEARHFNWEPWTGENLYVPAFGVPDAGIARRARGVVEKCTFCIQRIDRGLERGLVPGVDREATPACVVECPVEARFFGDLNDPNSKVSQLLATRPHIRLRDDLGTSPRVYYLPTLTGVPETTPPPIP